MNEIQQFLFAHQDTGYRSFHLSLIPNIKPDRVIGVRTPVLRAYAKQIAGTTAAEIFLAELPHRYYEENNLHAFLLENVKSFDTVIAELDRFLPHVDNWATCDALRPKVLKKHLPELLSHIDRWMVSEHPYTVRFGIEMLMCFYLDDAFCPDYLEQVAAIRSEEYYIRMMVAWFFATALAKQYEAASGFLENRSLDKWTHNKTIQKAIESYRITDEQKTYLRSLRIK